MTYRHVFDAWSSANERTEKELKIQGFLQQHFNLEDCSEPVENSLKQFAGILNVSLCTKWKDCNRTKQRFLDKNSKWLNSEVKLPKAVLDSQNTPAEKKEHSGRPKKSFDDCCVRSKKRKVAELVASYSTEELQFAVAQSLKKKNLCKEDRKGFSPSEALSLFYDLDLSEGKYIILRNAVNALHPKCFPSMKSIRKFKQDILPDSITVTETSAEVDLQALMYKTVESISQGLQLNKDTSAKLLCKWGFDGSGGHSIYKQAFTDSENTDQYMFMIALVPLKLIDVETGEDLWVNKRPNSSLSCRPVKFTFQKECPSLILQKKAEIKEKIDNLEDCNFNVKDFKLTVSFDLRLTMVDGSVCNILTGTNSTASCFMCGAKPSEMNSTALHVIEECTNEGSFEFGLSPLHCWIRCFECLLHIAYRLPVEVWQVRKEHSQVVLEEKNRIKREFKSKMGLIVDEPKQGFGSTNDGNTARRFFENPELSSEITGIDKELICKFSMILKVIASGRNVDLEKFGELLDQTKELYLKLYEWFYMPSSVHKLLVHGIDVIKSFDLPIGQYSEEALESLHKVFRYQRLHHTRKTSRVDTCRDLITNLLAMSDPIIAQNRKIIRKKSRAVENEIGDFLLEPDHIEETNDLDSSDDDSFCVE